MSEYAVVNPATGETLATYDTFTDEQVEAAIAAATAAHRGWSRTSTRRPSAPQLVRRVAELHRERREELADIIVREMGKPREAALGEVDFAADIVEYYADNAEEIMKDTPISILGEGTAVIRRSSLGPLLGHHAVELPVLPGGPLRRAEPASSATRSCSSTPGSAPSRPSRIEKIHRDAGFPEGAYVNVFVTQRAGGRRSSPTRACRASR